MRQNRKKVKQIIIIDYFFVIKINTMFIIINLFRRQRMFGS